VTETEVAEAALRATEAQVQNDREAVAAAEAAIPQAEAVLETARINLRYTRITAPISGQIGKSNVTVGALATAYQGSAFATIQQIDPIYVDATQSSASLLLLKRNIAAGRINGSGPDRARVRLLLEDGTPYPLEGTLKFSEVSVDPSTGSVILRMVFPNPKHILLPGMYVRAVVQEGEVTTQFLPRSRGSPATRRVIPLPWSWTAREKSGNGCSRSIVQSATNGSLPRALPPGDQVIVEGMQKVRPGSSVKVVPFQESGTSGPAPEKTAQPAPKSN